MLSLVLAVGLGKWRQIKQQFFAKHLCNHQSRGKTAVKSVLAIMCGIESTQ